MAGSSGFSNILGTLSVLFRIGLNGPAWMSNASKLFASSNDGASLVNVEVAYPVDAADAATKGYVDNVASLQVPQTRELATTEGIQGGGLLDDDRELKLNVNGLSSLGVVDPAADSVLVYDNSAGVHKKALISSLPGGTEAADISAEEAARIAADAVFAAVLGSQGAAVADAAAIGTYVGADTIDKAALIVTLTDLQTQFNLLKSRVEDHGLIAP